MKVSESKYAPMIERIREIHTNHGTKLWHEADEWGVNKYFPSENSDIIFNFYHNSLSRVRVPEGEITPLGSHQVGDVAKILEELKTEFGLEPTRTIDGATGERWHEYKATKGLP